MSFDTVLAEFWEALKPHGYRKKGRGFWKVEQGVYRLVDLQSGAHGSYFFVNLGIQPVGMPQLLVGRVSVRERPGIEECILQDRIESALNLDPERFGMIYVTDRPLVSELREALNVDVDAWFDRWADMNTLSHTTDAEVAPMISVVPLLTVKALWMLRTYCAVQIGNRHMARNALGHFLTAGAGQYDLSAVEEWFRSLVEDLK